MIDIIKNFDRMVIFFIDKHITSGWIIFFFNIFTYIGYFAAGWIIFFIIYSRAKKEKFIWLFWGITFTAVFILSEVLLKNIAARPRPFMEISGLAINTFKTGSFSFPSSHAFFSGASVLIFFKLEKELLSRLIIITVSVLISVSRIILKVHYPSDVIFGYFLGIITALMVKIILNKMYKKYENDLINNIK